MFSLFSSVLKTGNERVKEAEKIKTFSNQEFGGRSGWIHLKLAKSCLSVYFPLVQSFFTMLLLMLTLNEGQKYAKPSVVHRMSKALSLRFTSRHKGGRERKVENRSHNYRIIK